MSRVKVKATPTSVVTTGPSMTHETEPTRIEPGLAGPYSLGVVAQSDERVRRELQRLLEAAREIRPTLRERQGKTEADGQYAEDVHEHFIEHGFYRMLLPLTHGGLELGIPGFLAVIAEVARGCPSTAWCLSLSSAHSLTLASYWPEAVQNEVFGANGYMIAPASGQIAGSKLVPVEGGYRLTGTWRYCSGAPYSTHFFPTVVVPATDDEPEHRAWVVVDRADFEVLDDWGRVIGMRGSGSNGITMQDVFVPAERVVAETWASRVDEPTIGYELHGNPLYSGVFFGFAEGEVAAVAVGLGYAAIDEYERAIRISRAPYDPAGSKRVDNDDWRRVLGLAIAKVDAAFGVLIEQGRLYEEHARRLVVDGTPFDDASAMRINNAHLVAEDLVWEMLQQLIRTAGTGFSADGQALQRYFRDIWTTVSRTDQLEFFAAPTAGYHLAGRAMFEADHPDEVERLAPKD
ncbi:acyl-CoA dehydrogenase family protein [Agrococcus citreus]|uniref:Acyl-CoA dehydrogenase family protein n=1 Tax=Agrococcus citreus TaxID=84643 RepID=A0ABP4JNM0_9MICO